MAAQSFVATLELGRKTATGIEVPASVVEGLNAGKRIPVRVKLNGYEYRTTVAPMSGRYFIPVAREVREGAGLAAGDQVNVEMTVDTDERTVTVPQDLADALATVPGATERFAALSYTFRKEHARAVESAKAAETRARRIAKIVESLNN